RLRTGLTRQYNLNKRFDEADFISLLFYQGIITIEDNEFDVNIFKMPNYVIQQLYFQYFHQIVLERSQLDELGTDVRYKVVDLAKSGNILPLVEYTEKILQELAVRDTVRFDEKYIRAIFTAAVSTSGIYIIRNEFEVKIPIQSGSTGKGFVDLLLLERLPYQPKYQIIIEVKYLQKKDHHRLETVKQEAIEQLQNYLKQDEFLNGLKKLKAFVIVFVGFKGEIVELGLG
ncbi:MAG: PD-(D/E)XK nuclease domain-containing protein, partial [Bacteroidota bacterium]